MKTIAEHIAEISERIAAAARRAGRDPAEITLVAVSKTHPPEVVQQAVEAGIIHLGENRVQEARPKIAALAEAGHEVRWHLVGQLQRNKAKPAASLFDMVHSLDSEKLAETLNRHVDTLIHESAGDLPPEVRSRPPDYRLPVLLQVNVSGELSKSGFNLPGGLPDDGLKTSEASTSFLEEVERILAFHRLEVQGLMTMAPFVRDPAPIRATFRTLHHLRETLARQFPAARWETLSMGMTDDFEIAVEEGATLVRIGRGIFGNRTEHL
jgi:PLP dependent protein